VVPRGLGGMRPLSQTQALIASSTRFARAVAQLRFGPPVTHVYNPLRYARRAHQRYLERFGAGTGRVVLLGMNPGPYGMAQTGVPFGEVEAVRDWMGIETPIGQPPKPHPKRPVTGFACRRSEVSGQRLWGWARARFGTPERFFRAFFVVNYCPLVFMEASGRNRTPDKLPAGERKRLFRICDRALRETIAILEPSRLVGVGRFAESRARVALEGSALSIGMIPHPSPASPAANRGWRPAAEQALQQQGVRGLR